MEVSSKEFKSSKMSLEEFWVFCDNNEGTWEFVNGVPVLQARLATPHIDISSRISRILDQYFEGKPCVSRQEYPVKLNASVDQIRVPDFIVNCDVNKQCHNMIIGAPDLTMEIWNKKYDVKTLIDKNKEYTDAGVREIWNIMLGLNRADLIYMKGDKYCPLSFNFSEVMESPTFPGLRFDFSMFTDADDFTGYNV